MVRLRTFDLSLRTAYAQAKETALAQHQVRLLTAGTVQVEIRAGGKFAYRYRYDATGKRITEYLGPEPDGQTKLRIEQARLEIGEQEILAASSQRLRKIGFYSADNSTVITVASLFNAGVFGKGAG